MSVESPDSRRFRGSARLRPELPRRLVHSLSRLLRESSRINGDGERRGTSCALLSAEEICSAMLAPDWVPMRNVDVSRRMALLLPPLPPLLSLRTSSTTPGAVMAADAGAGDGASPVPPDAASAGAVTTVGVVRRRVVDGERALAGTAAVGGPPVVADCCCACVCCCACGRWLDATLGTGVGVRRLWTSSSAATIQLSPVNRLFTLPMIA